jgi:4-amino-4-deoxy-L-arabinose transferase-like glycosyltransferase
MDLLTLLLAVLAFCAVAWLIRRFGTEPYATYGLWALAVFALIFVCERLGLFGLLRGIRI